MWEEEEEKEEEEEEKKEEEEEEFCACQESKPSVRSKNADRAVPTDMCVFYIRPKQIPSPPALVTSRAEFCVTLHNFLREAADVRLGLVVSLLAYLRCLR